MFGALASREFSYPEPVCGADTSHTWGSDTQKVTLKMGADPANSFFLQLWLLSLCPPWGYLGCHGHVWHQSLWLEVQKDPKNPSFDPPDPPWAEGQTGAVFSSPTGEKSWFIQRIKRVWWLLGSPKTTALRYLGWRGSSGPVCLPIHLYQSSTGT